MRGHHAHAVHLGDTDGGKERRLVLARAQPLVKARHDLLDMIRAAGVNSAIAEPRDIPVLVLEAKEVSVIASLAE